MPVRDHDLDVRKTPEEIESRKRFWFLFWFIGSCSVFALCLVGAALFVRFKPLSSVSGGSGGSISLSSYNRIETGHSVGQVNYLLGQNGVELSSTDLGGFRSEVYQWKKWDGSNVTATFQNGRLVSKAQSGL